MKIFKKIKDLFKRRQIENKYYWEISNTLELISDINKLHIFSNTIKSSPFYFEAQSDINRWIILEAWFETKFNSYYFRYRDKSIIGENTWLYSTEDISKFNEELLKLPVLKSYNRNKKLTELLNEN